jgi:aminoglycoside 3-N-acetyltransferase
MRNLLRKLTPAFLLNFYRESKKRTKNADLQKEKSAGKIYSKKDLIRQFKKIGIQEGDSLLVHSSLSKIGYVENGAKDVVDALLECIGDKGNLLMPNSPNASFQLDYIQNIEFFDVANSPSKLGAISEYFRLLPDAQRSAHPTEPVSCIGPDTEYFVGHHFGNLTPYNENSPFYRVAERNGKILYLGVTLDNAGTNLHTLEDAVENFKFPVYYPQEFEVKVLFNNRTLRTMKTLVHNPEQSKKRKCDGLIPLFEEKGVLKKVKIGKANSLLVNAKGMFDLMLEEYKKNGVTMYTPKGS